MSPQFTKIINLTKPNNPNKPALSRYILPLILFILIGLSLAAAVWQWQRSQYHEGLLQAALQRQAQPASPINLNALTDLSQAAVMVGDAVMVSGSWLPNSTTYVSPRLHNGQQGALLVSVLAYQDTLGSPHYLAVNRGWARQAAANAAPIMPELSSAVVHLSGDIINHLPTAFELKTLAITQLGLWQNYDGAAHARLLHKSLQPYILQLSDQSADAEAGVLQRVSSKARSDEWAEKAAKNRGYMVQWLGLFIVGLVGLGVLWRKRVL